MQNLCRALVRGGHDVALLCQEPEPLAYDFVEKSFTAGPDGVSSLGGRETPYPGRCAVYRPEIGDLLPVYVYDDYPGWRVKTFLTLEEEEFEHYAASNAAAIRAIVSATGAEAVVTNHSVPGPYIARRALKDTAVPYVSIVHGSCLQYVARKSERYMDLTREGLQGAKSIVALSSHSAGTIAEDFPEMEMKTLAVPGGVDTNLFRPDALDLDFLKGLTGGSGRGPEQNEALGKVLETSTTAEELAGGLGSVAATYNARVHDNEAGERLGAFLETNSGAPLVIYVGKLIHSKGVHSLLSAFARLYRETGARLLVVGYGTFRETLQALVRALDRGDAATVELLAGSGRLYEGGIPAPMEHFKLTDELWKDARGIEKAVEFIGPLYHGELAKLLPAADVAVVPSIFPETFGLVAAEFAAAGVPPVVADHSGLREAGGIVGHNLPFEIRVGMENFEDNLAAALTSYLARSEKERREYRETVRRNSVEHLSWDTLGERIAALARG